MAAAYRAEMQAASGLGTAQQSDSEVKLKACNLTLTQIVSNMFSDAKKFFLVIVTNHLFLPLAARIIFLAPFFFLGARKKCLVTVSFFLASQIISVGVLTSLTS